MSEKSRKSFASLESASTARPALQRRLAVYAGAGVLVVLAIAWFDGGEESIRPIVQPVTLAPVGEFGE